MPEIARSKKQSGKQQQGPSVDGKGNSKEVSIKGSH